MGVRCNLVTGQEIRRVKGARHTSCTVEMADLTNRVDVSDCVWWLRICCSDDSCTLPAQHGIAWCSIQQVHSGATRCDGIISIAYQPVVKSAGDILNSSLWLAPATPGSDCNIDKARGEPSAAARQQHCNAACHMPANSLLVCERPARCSRRLVTLIPGLLALRDLCATRNPALCCRLLSWMRCKCWATRGVGGPGRGCCWDCRLASCTSVGTQLQRSCWSNWLQHAETN